MADTATEPIIERLHQLTEIVNCVGVGEALDASILQDLQAKEFSQQLLARDGLLDALLLLYDECNSNDLKKNPIVSSFIDKYKSTLKELRKLRVNINDFELKKVIGIGHFGVVQVVKEKQSGNVYALKTIRKSDTLSQQHVAFFEEERDIMAKATSNWITHLQYAFQDDSHLYLVMEFHPGGDLFSLMERYEGIFSEEMARFYLSEVALAINTLHTMGYVHRDIKPDNILIDRCGHIKLADFGSAAKLTASGKVNSKMPVGTADYIAPEVLAAMNESKEGDSYGVACDFWSLGIMAYEMLYGKTPFKDSSVVVIYSNIMNHKEALKFDTEVNVSENAQDLILNLLEDVNKRITYSGIVHHQFFLHTDWFKLHLVKPPFIPVVNTVDDTSNFDEFDADKRPPVKPLKNSKEGFSGENLPFVGFTYARPIADNKSTIGSLDSTLASMTSEESHVDKTIIEVELQNKKKELHVLQLKMRNLTDSSSDNSEFLQARKKLTRIEKRCELIEQDRKRLEEEAKVKDRNLLKLQNRLAHEKSDREKTERKTIEMIRDIKKKWKKEAEAELQTVQEENRVLHLGFKNEVEEKKQALNQVVDLLNCYNKANAALTKYKKLTEEKSNECSALKQQLEEIKCDGSCAPTSSKLNETIINLEKMTKNYEDLKQKYGQLKTLNESLQCDMESYTDLKMKYKELEVALEKRDNELQLTKENLETFNKQMKEKDNIRELDVSQRVKSLQQQLKQKQEEVNILNESLMQTKSSLDSTISTTESKQISFLQREEELQSEVSSLQVELKSASSKNSSLRTKLEQAAFERKENERKIEDLNQRLKAMDETFQYLDSKHSSKGSNEDALRAKIELLETQLQASKDLAKQDKEKVNELLAALNKMKEEASDFDLDKRILEKDLKTAKDTQSYLRDCNRELKEQSKKQLEDLSKREQENDKLSKQIKNLELDIQDKEKKFEAKLSLFESKTKKIEDLQNSLSEACLQLENSKKDYEHQISLKKDLESKVRLMQNEKKSTKSYESSLHSDIKELKEKIAEHEKNATMMKELIQDQDEQLSCIDSYESKMSTFQTEKLELEKTIETLKVELKAARAEKNEEVSLRLFQERKVKEAEERIASAEQEYDQQLSVLQEQANQYNNDNLQLRNELSDIKEELDDTHSQLSDIQRKYSDAEGTLEQLQVENSGHINHIHSLKESNFVLTQGIEEAISKAEKFKTRITELENEIKHINAVNEDTKIRMTETISQQTKLIDFLQPKTENTPRKKKNILRIFSGSSSHTEKENKAVNFAVPHQYKDLQELLAQECQQTKTLNRQLEKANNEIANLKSQIHIAQSQSKLRLPEAAIVPTTPKVRQALKDLADSPTVQNSAYKKRMRHAIPHRWQTTLVMHGSKCCGCLDNLPFARKALKCQECGHTAHNKCSDGLQSSCGLPAAFAHHYIENNSNILQGWLKLRNANKRDLKSSWTKLYVCLEDKQLVIYDGEPNVGSVPINKILLDKKTYSVTVTNAVTKSEVPDTCDTDLPYIFKIEKGCKGSLLENTIYIMSKSFEEKRLWITSLENTLSQFSLDETIVDVTESFITSKNLLTLPKDEPLDINTLIYLNKNIVLLGCSEGLYSVCSSKDGSLDIRARIQGLDKVHQVLQVDKINKTLFIAGSECYVYMIDNKILEVAAEAHEVAHPRINPSRVGQLQGCHLLAQGQTTSGEIFFCAATTDRISIQIWQEEKNQFKMCRQYSPQEPCSCFLFTKASLIVGAEKFYEIDLKTFSIDEFLDESDKSLGYALYGSNQMPLFPLSIIQISPPGKYGEYLLCFYEFAIFVDPYGRRSREFDIKFTRLPISINFEDPYLFIVHQNAVEVLEIHQDSFTKISGTESDTDSEFAPSVRTASKSLSSPRFLGHNSANNGIVMSSMNGNSVEIVELISNFPEDSIISSWDTPTISVSPKSQDNLSFTSGVSSATDLSEEDNSFKRTKSQRYTCSKRSKVTL